MNDLMVFSNDEFGEVRVVDINGECWLVGKDVVDKLGYDTTTNSYNFYLNKFVDEEDKLKCDSQSSLIGDYRQLGQRGGYLINESGLYSLVLSSKLPSAKKFKKWITSEVLPSIRKTGSYMAWNVDKNALSAPKTYLEALLECVRLEKERIELSEKLESQKPLVAIADVRMEKKGCFSITDATKSLGLKRGQITKWAKEKGYLHKKLQEVNELGKEFFKVYSSDGVHNQIGINDIGMALINKNLQEIKTIR